jgi:predicted AAA+ superfamily ATPase
MKSTTRMPLLLRGARQVGKTFIVEHLGKHYFKNFININFELEPEYIDCFNSLKPEDILNSLRALSRQSITPGETLIFFDEIQNCPKAIMSLRYFKEQLPVMKF